MEVSAEANRVLKIEARKGILAGGMDDMVTQEVIGRWVDDSVRASEPNPNLTPNPDLTFVSVLTLPEEEQMAFQLHAVQQAARDLQLQLASGDMKELVVAIVDMIWNSKQPAPSSRMALFSSTAEEAVRGWEASRREELELQAEVASALEKEAQAQRLMLPHAACSRLAVQAVKAVKAGEEVVNAVRAALAEWHRQMLRRQVLQTVWDPSGNESRRMSGMVRFMPFKQQTADNLEYELLSLVFAKLPFNELGILSLVCKRWHSVASDPSWKPELVAYSWGDPQLNGLGKADGCLKPSLLDFSIEKQARGTNPELTSVSALACTPSGYFHGRMERQGFSCAAVTSGGALFTWGLNDTGQLLVERSTALIERPTRAEEFSGAWRQEKVVGVALGLRFITLHTTPPTRPTPASSEARRASRVLSCGRFCHPYDDHELRELTELQGKPLRQLAAGAFHCVALTTRGQRSGLAREQLHGDWFKRVHTHKRPGGMHCVAVITRATRQRHGYAMLALLTSRDDALVKLPHRSARQLPLRGRYACRAGDVITWGHQRGQDESNGNLLGHGVLDRSVHSLPPKLLAMPGLGPVAEVACSSVSPLQALIPYYSQ
ncbi:MAG: hypothetical protein SGPRY_008256 [Prymnesium sp.]